MFYSRYTALFDYRTPRKLISLQLINNYNDCISLSSYQHLFDRVKNGKQFITNYKIANIFRKTSTTIRFLNRKMKIYESPHFRVDMHNTLVYSLTPYQH